MTIHEILKNATNVLRASEIAEPRREAASLLAFALGKDRTFLIVNPNYLLSDEENARFENFLNRRAGREPLQYITEKQEFFGLEFTVSPAVLIPRPETEIIVETALELLRAQDAPRFGEIGVGSGCISISLLNEMQNASAVAGDVSQDALETAHENAAKHNVLNRLQLVKSDVFESFAAEAFDLIVSNPPYISMTEMTDLQKEVRDFEPWTALTDGRDGFSIIEKIIVGAPRFLKPGGFLLLEIGFGQHERIYELAARKIWEKPEILPDLQGIPRTLKARLKNV